MFFIYQSSVPYVCAQKIRVSWRREVATLLDNFYCFLIQFKWFIVQLREIKSLKMQLILNWFIAMLFLSLSLWMIKSHSSCVSDRFQIIRQSSLGNFLWHHSFIPGISIDISLLRVWRQAFSRSSANLSSKLQLTLPLRMIALLLLWRWFKNSKDLLFFGVKFLLTESLNF